MLRTILIGLDESASGNCAVELGIRWAKRYDALLAAIAIVDEPTIRRPEPVPIGGGAFKVDRDTTLLEDAHNRVDKMLSRFVQRCTEQQVRHETVKEIGEPGLRILERSKVHDLIIVGQQANFHFETQDQEDETIGLLMRESSRPVVTTPETLTDSSLAVVAYNGSPQADRALQAFVTLGLAAEYEIQVLTADTDGSAAGSLARQAVEYFKLHDITAHVYPSAPAGSVSAAIVQAVQELRAGLLVMGACGGSWLREKLLGSTTAEVVAASPVPVFLTH